MDNLWPLNLAVILALAGIFVMLVTRVLDNYPIVQRGIIRINLTRYSWLTGLLLIGLVPAAIFLAPALLWNLFVIEGSDFFWVTLMAALTAATVILTARVTLQNAPERFDVSRSEFKKKSMAARRPGWSLTTWLVFFGLTIPVPALAAFASWSDRVGSYLPDTRWHDVLWMTTGLAAALIWLLVNVGLHWTLLGGPTVAEGLLPFERWFTKCRNRFFDRVNRVTGWLGKSLKRLGPGYENDGQPCPGHVQAILFGLLGLIGYVAVYFICVLGGHRQGSVWVPFPSLSLILLLFVLDGTCAG